MSKIELVSFKVGNWVWNSTGRAVETREELVIKDKDLQGLTHKIQNITTSKIENGQNVYFDDKVIFPRKKFKKCFPLNKIVYSLEKADIMVVDKGRLLGEFRYFHLIDYYKEPDGSYSRYSSKAGGRKLPNQYTYYNYSEKEVERMNRFVEWEKGFIDVKDLNLASEEVLDNEAADRIGKMFSGTDDSMRNMAMNLLTAYDYNKEKAKIAMILNNHWYKWRGARDKKINVEIRTMLRKLSIDFPGFDNDSRYDRSFWLRLGISYPDDPVINDILNQKMKEELGQDTPDIVIKMKANEWANRGF